MKKQTTFAIYLLGFGFCYSRLDISLHGKRK